MMGTIERELHERYIQTHRKFFPRPPVFPERPSEAVMAAAVVAPLPRVKPIKIVGANETATRIKIIRRAVCINYDISEDALLGQQRKPEFVRPRHVYSYLASRLTRASLPMIARTLNQDHTSVLHAVRSITRKVHESFELARRLNMLEQSIHIQFGEWARPRDCIGRYVQHHQVADYLLLGWMWAANLNEYAALLIWPCDCRFVEPKG